MSNYWPHEYVASDHSKCEAVVAMCIDALAVQDAPNVMGITKSLCDHLCQVSGDGEGIAKTLVGDRLFHLPCVKMFVHQLCFLTNTGAGLGSQEWGECHKWCWDVIEASETE